MMGIGVFSAEAPPRYMELVKEQVMKQKMYVVLATSDYIYGTNYQFANLYLGKDMRLSQEKLIQTLGRVGRGLKEEGTLGNAGFGAFWRLNDALSLRTEARGTYNFDEKFWNYTALAGLNVVLGGHLKPAAPVVEVAPVEPTPPATPVAPVLPVAPTRPLDTIANISWWLLANPVVPVPADVTNVDGIEM
jgi:hypothetical protein